MGDNFWLNFLSFFFEKIACTCVFFDQKTKSFTSIVHLRVLETLCAVFGSKNFLGPHPTKKLWCTVTPFFVPYFEGGGVQQNGCPFLNWARGALFSCCLLKRLNKIFCVYLCKYWFHEFDASIISCTFDRKILCKTT